jgi:hypothetical protein
MTRFAILCSLLLAAANLVWAQQPWVVEGKVTDDSGPVRDVSMHIVGGGMELEASTDENGHFKASGTAPGKYTIYPEKDGYEGGEGMESRSAIRIDLAAGTHFRGANFVVHRAASISGRILDSNRKPIEGAVVVLSVKTFEGYRAYLKTRAAVESDASGTYVLKNIGAGTYYLRADLPLRDNAKTPSGPREPRIAPVRTYYPNATTPDNAAPISVSRAEQLGGVDVAMAEAPTFCVTGKFVMAAGEVPLWTRIAVAQQVGSTWAGWVGAGNASPGEEFEVCDLVPASYALTILSLGTDQLARVVSQAFTIANRDVALGDLSALAALRLRGEVIVPGAHDDSPLPAGIGVEVRSLSRPYPFAGEGRAGHVNSKGEFSIEVFADDYSLRITGLPRGYYVQTVFQAGRDVTNQAIRPGDDVTITLSSDGPVVSGATMDSNNHPVPNAEVMLIRKDSSLGSIVAIRSDGSGRFQVQSGIAPGKYAIVAFTDLYEGEDQNPEFARDQMAGATQLDLDKSETKSVTLTVRDAHRP